MIEHTKESLTKKASWLELFYDLVFVAIIAQFTYAVADQAWTMEGFVLFFLVGYMIYMAWWGMTVSRNLQDSESTKDRLYTQVLMLCALLLSILLPDIFAEQDVSRFFLAYALIRLIQLLMLFRMYRLSPESAPQTYNIAQAFGLAIGLFVLAAFLPLPYALVLAFAGLSLEIFGPLAVGKNNKIRLLNVSHMQERLGLFLLLIIGESVLVVALTNTVTTVDLVRPTVVFAGTINMIALWWLYFSHLEGEAEGRRPKNLPLYVHGHCFLFGSIVLMASAFKNILKHGYEFVLSDAVLLSAGAFLMITMLMLLRHAIFELTLKQLRLPSAVALICLLIGYLGYLLQSINIVMFGTSILLVLLAFIDERRRSKW